MKYETKGLTLAQRVECNDLQVEFDPIRRTTITKDIFAHRVKYLKYGLKSLNGEEITEANFDQLVMTLSNDEIEEISDKIASETNFPKKK